VEPGRPSTPASSARPARSRATGGDDTVALELDT